MCLHRSYVVTEDYKILSTLDNDHHTEIRSQHRISDGLRHKEFSDTSIEFRPVTDLFDLDKWEFRFDDSKPEWWSKEHMGRTQKELEKDFLRYNKKDSTYIFPGDLDLRDLRGLQPNTTIIANGCIILSSIDCIPPDCTIIAKKHGIDLRSLRHCYDGVSIIAPEIRVIHPSILEHANAIHGRNYRGRNSMRYTDDFMDSSIMVAYQPRNLNPTYINP